MSKKEKDQLNENDDNLRSQNQNDDEDFGLPGFEDESEQNISEEQPEEVVDPAPTFHYEEETPSYYQQDSAKQQDNTTVDGEEFDSSEYADIDRKKGGKSAAPVIITLLVLLLVASGIVYFLFFYNAPKPEPIVEAPVVVIEPEPEPEPEPVIEAPKIGVVTVLTQRSQRSYVVIASFFDEDMARDYANDLAKDGHNITIIPPFGKSKFNRVAIEDYDTFSEATRRAEALSGQYKEEPWPLKY
jgi:hypothetical protein